MRRVNHSGFSSSTAHMATLQRAMADEGVGSQNADSPGGPSRPSTLERLGERIREPATGSGLSDNNHLVYAKPRIAD